MNYQTLNSDALLRGADVYLPRGPVPFKRSAFLARVARGEAPAPALRTGSVTAWRWGDIERYLKRLAESGDARIEQSAHAARELADVRDAGARGAVH